MGESIIVHFKYLKNDHKKVAKHLFSFDADLEKKAMGLHCGKTGLD